MKNNSGSGKRALSLVLSTIMLLSLVPTTTALNVSAETNGETNRAEELPTASPDYNPSVVSDGIVAGDFIVSASDGGTLTEGVDYSFKNSILTILSETPIIVKNKSDVQTTANRIYVADGVSANIILAGVNISTSSGGAPFEIAEDSVGDVTITLKEETSNTLTSKAGNYAALQKNGDASVGTLTIQGEGELTATGGTN